MPEPKPPYVPTGVRPPEGPPPRDPSSEPFQRPNIARPWYKRAMQRAGLLKYRAVSEEEAARARLGAERVNAALPEALSGREAVLRQRARQQQAYEASRDE